MYEKKGVSLLSLNMVFSFGLFYCIAADMLLVALLLVFFIMLFNGAKDVALSRCDGSVGRMSGALLAVLYPAICFGFLFRLNGFDNTLIPILAILIWITDTFAFFIGMTLGKHRGFFKCSPKKSIEGFIGGLVFAFIGSCGVMIAFPDIYSFGHVIVLAIAAGIFGQFGDLFESIIKRDMDVKDSSSLIPGHGGVLDRFDSLLIAAPALYVMIKILG
jgi:phosphatidate cytidylyltransferase